MANNNTIKPQGEGWKAVVNGVEVRQTKGGLLIGQGLDTIFISGDSLRLVDPTSRIQGKYPDSYPFAAPHEHSLDEENKDLVLDRSYPPDGIPLELLPKAIRELKAMLLGNVSIQGNFPTNEITGEYEGPLEKGDLVSWDAETSSWVAASCPASRGLADNALFTGVAFPESDEVLSAASVVCDSWDLIPGQAYYLDCANPGKMTPEDTGFYVGVAQSKTAMYFAPYAASLEQVLTNMQNQISAADTTVKEIQEEFAGVQQTVEEMQAIVEEVKANDDATETRLADLLQKAADAQNSIVDLQAKIAQLEAVDTTYRGYFNNIASQFSTITTTISNITESLTASDDEIRRNIAEVQKRIDEINKILGTGTESFRQLVEKHEADIAEIRTILGDCSCASIKQWIGQVNQNVADGFNHLNDAIKANSSAINTNRQDLDTVTKDYNGFKVAHKEWENVVAQNLGNIATLQSGLTQVSGRVAKNEADIGVLKQKDIELKADIDKNTGLITANGLLITDNKAAIASLRGDFTNHAVEYQGHVEYLATKVGEHENELKNLETADTGIQKDLLTVSTRVLTLENILADSIPGECKCDFTEINQQIAKNTADITTASNELSKTQNHVIELHNEVMDMKGGSGLDSDWKNNVDSSIQTLITQAATCSEVNTLQSQQITTITESVTKVNESFTTLQPQVESIQTNLDDINQKIEDGTIGGGGGDTVDHSIYMLKTEFNAFKTSNDSALQDLTAADQTMATKVSEIETSVGTIQTDLAQQESTLTDLSTTVTEVKNEVKDITTGPNGIGTDLTALKSKVEANSSAISALQDLVGDGGTGGVEGSTAILQQLQQLQESMANQASTLESLQNANKSLTDSLSTANATIGTLQTTLGSVQSELTTTKASLTAAETELAATKNDLASTKTNLDTTTKALETAQGTISGLQDTVSGQATTIGGLQEQLTTTTNNVTNITNKIESGEIGGKEKWGISSNNTIANVTQAEVDSMPEGGFISVVKS